MGTLLSYSKVNQHQFTISYPHYGLFRTADVRLVPEEGDPVFECRLINGAIVQIKKVAGSRQWVEAGTNMSTSLAFILGRYIDDLLEAQ